MISAIVYVPFANARPAARDGELLVRSLVWLVSAVVSGVVRDVTLAGGPMLGLGDIADQSGCGFVEGTSEAACLHRALAVGRGTGVLIVASGYQPGETMVGELDGLARSLGAKETARLLATPVTRWQRLSVKAAPTIGLLAPSAKCRAMPARSFPQLVAKLRPQRSFVTRATPIL